MAQWPLAHEYEITYMLSRGVLEVKTTLINRGSAPTPLVIGFHSYYHLPEVPRDEWFANGIQQARQV
jgi:galactose mutarotase-like enzyme